MSARSSPIIVLPGASGKTPDLSIFGTAPRDNFYFKTIRYPGWQRYIESGFSADTLIADLACQIATVVPKGPIRIVGFSIGGHFGYSAALHLQARGRDIARFCAIDAFMTNSVNARPGWKTRALVHGLSLLRDRRLNELNIFLRLRLWRALLRSAGGRLPRLLRAIAPSGRLPRILAHDPFLEEELNLRLLIREIVPWIRLLDLEPVALEVPAVLFRTREQAGDDAAWSCRCPNIEFFDIPGTHESIVRMLENAENYQTSWAPGDIATVGKRFYDAILA